MRRWQKVCGRSGPLVGRTVNFNSAVSRTGRSTIFGLNTTRSTSVRCRMVTTPGGGAFNLFNNTGTRIGTFVRLPSVGPGGRGGGARGLAGPTTRGPGTGRRGAARAGGTRGGGGTTLRCNPCISRDRLPTSSHPTGTVRFLGPVLRDLNYRGVAFGMTRHRGTTLVSLSNRNINTVVKRHNRALSTLRFLTNLTSGGNNKCCGMSLGVNGCHRGHRSALATLTNHVTRRILGANGYEALRPVGPCRHHVVRATIRTVSNIADTSFNSKIGHHIIVNGRNARLEPLEDHSSHHNNEHCSHHEDNGHHPDGGIRTAPGHRPGGSDSVPLCKGVGWVCGVGAWLARRVSDPRIS